MTEADILKVRKRRVCPGCGMTIEEGGEMFRSLTMPGKFVCLTCAIREKKKLGRDGKYEELCAQFEIRFLNIIRRDNLLYAVYGRCRNLVEEENNTSVTSSSKVSTVDLFARAPRAGMLIHFSSDQRSGIAQSCFLLSFSLSLEPAQHISPI